jgi:hypothetical protein
MKKLYLFFSLLCFFSKNFANAEFKNFNKHFNNFYSPSNVIQPADVTLCNGASSSTIIFTSSVAGTTFIWTNNNTSIGLGASGSGNIAPFTATNTGTTPIIATITVTPSTGTPKTFTITVNPIPTVNNVANQSLCRNSSTTAVNFTGSTPGTVYNWTNSNVAIGLAASGSGNIASFTGTNSTNAPITGTITATPRFGTGTPELLYYKFDGSGSTVPNLASNPPAGTATGNISGPNMNQGGSGVCGGALQCTSVSSDGFNPNWSPNIAATSWTLSFISNGFPTSGGGVFATLGSYGFTGNTFYVDYGAATNFTGGFRLDYAGVVTNFNVPITSGGHTITFVYSMTANELRGYRDGILVNTLNTGNTPLGIICNNFLIGRGFNSPGGATQLSIPAGSSLDEVRLYSRALTLSEIQALTNNCNGGGVCTGTPETFTYTVYPDLVVNDPADQTICAGSATAAVNFTGTAGAVYNWTNNNTSIGLAASGTGNIPSFTPIFSGTSPITATITVTPSFSGGPSCTASTQTFTITVNPIPTVNNVANQTICNNTSTTAVNFTGTIPGTNYSWINSNPAIGLSANGSGNIQSFTAINTSGSPVTSTVTVTPTFGSAVPDILYYKFDGAGTTVPNLASNPPAGATSATINGGLTQGGAGICNGTLIGVSNPGSSDFMNTNWIPNLNGSWTISFKTNTSSTAGIFSVNGGTLLRSYRDPNNNYTLTSNSFPAFDIQAASNTSPTVTYVCDNTLLILKGYLNGVLANTVSLTSPVNFTGTQTLRVGFALGAAGLPSGALIDEFRVYNRALPVNEIMDLANSCTPGAACTGTPETFTITVNPSHVINTVSNQNICTGNNTTAINFTGNVAGATYNWTNNNTSIGLAASGTGNIPSFTATNTGTTTQTATITVIPVSPNIPACAGTPETFTIAVSPVPTGTANPASQTICSQSAINTISFTGNIPGITFDWTRDNLATVTGISGVGNGNINGVLTNTTNAPITVTFTVTPSIAGCIGTPFDVTVIVREALPNVVATPSTQTICSGASITTIVLTSAVSGTTFNWTRNNNATVTGIASAGSGNINGALVNTTALPITVNFTITPVANGCIGVASSATIVVNPVPNAIATPNVQTICSNTAITPIVLSSSVIGTTYNWTRDNTTNVTGIATNGTNNINGTLVNITNAPTTTTFTITPVSASGCLVNATTAQVLINPRAIVNLVGNQVLCNGTTTNAINFSSLTTGGTIVYNWINDSPSIGLAATGTGNIASFTAINTTNAPVVANITVTPTFTNGISCTGAPQTFTITVNPTPIVNTVANISFCNAVASTPINFNGVVAGTVYSWTNNNTAIGLAATGMGTIASFLPTNVGITPITATITVTPLYTNAGVTCNGVSTSFTLTVNPSTRITTQPVDRAICFGTSTAYVVTATGLGLTYQWQVNPGSGYTNIIGANTPTLNIPAPPSNLNFSGNRYRCIITGICGADTSVGALLTIIPLPNIVLNASPRERLLPNQTTGIIATVSPSGGTFNWYYKDTLVSGITGATFNPITIDQLGNYKAVYTDLNGCTSTAFPVTITGEPSDNLWVFPNPNQGQFNIRFYNQNKEQAIVSIYNSTGNRIFQKNITTANTYNTVSIDIRNQTAGYYLIEVTNKNNTRLAVKRIVLQP